MKFPQSFIEEIRNRVRVSEVVGAAIPIKRAGREYHALCPFHKEKSPSFTVNDEKGFFTALAVVHTAMSLVLQWTTSILATVRPLRNWPA